MSRFVEDISDVSPKATAFSEVGWMCANGQERSVETSPYYVCFTCDSVR